MKYHAVGWDIHSSSAPFFTGEVIEVGSDVSSRFRTSDRVLVIAARNDRDRNNPAEGAFENYSDVPADLATQFLQIKARRMLLFSIRSGCCSFRSATKGTFWIYNLQTTPVVPSTDKTLIPLGVDQPVFIATRSRWLLQQLRGVYNGIYKENITRNCDPRMVSAQKDKTVAGALAIGSSSV
ncbi:hypothetical protein BGW37DRAFT_553007 [Umbelopsis sp. PMI_123]|nr:hypothetical protein BGW37DRAFT_553007 [Umbelopsis sp. PMI_123]